VDEFEQAASLFKALGHPVRVQIVEVLARDGEACVCHLECLLGQRQPQISQHLMRLKEAGLVTGRREGLNIYYSLVDREILPLLQASTRIAERFAGLEGRKGQPRGIAAPTRECPCPKCNLAAAPVVT